MTAVAAALFALSLAPPAQGDVTLWITLGDSDELVEADAYTFQIRRWIKVDPRPHGLAASPDGRQVYVASDKTGDFQVVDSVRGEVVGEIHIGDDPNQMTLTPDARFAFVPLRGENAVAVVRLAPLELVKKIPSPARPHDAYTASDGRIYVGTMGGNTISVFDPVAQAHLHDIPMSDAVRPLSITRDSRTVYAALSNLLGFAVVDTASRNVTRTVRLGSLPPGAPRPYLDTFTHALQLTADERELWVTDCIHDLVRVVRLPELKEVSQVHLGHLPHWFALRPDGKVLFVSSWLSDAVSAVDVASRRIIGNIAFPRGSGPKRILVAAKPRD